MIKLWWEIEQRLDGSPSRIYAWWITPDGKGHRHVEHLDEGATAEEAYHCVAGIAMTVGRANGVVVGAPEGLYVVEG